MTAEDFYNSDRKNWIPLSIEKDNLCFSYNDLIKFAEDYNKYKEENIKSHNLTMSGIYIADLDKRPKK